MSRCPTWVKALATKHRQLIEDPEEKLALLFIGTLTTGLLLIARQLALLQPLELVAYDHMLRLRPDRGPDPRLLVVEIS